jgi:hypothetical protein
MAVVNRMKSGDDVLRMRISDRRGGSGPEHPVPKPALNFDFQSKR